MKTYQELSPTMQKFSKLGIYVGGLTVALGMIWLVGGVQAKSVYQAQAPQAQKTYETAALTACNAELALVNAKLLDSANNALKLTPEQVRDLEAKKQTMKCGF